VDTPAANPESILRVLQFNILADSLADGSDALEPHLVPPVAHLCAAGGAGCHYHEHRDTPTHKFRTCQGVLDWEYREPKIMEIILQENPDIICLQEVDRFYDMEKKFEAAGYKGTFCKKAWKKIKDGCAVFWKEKTLNLTKVHTVQLLRDNAMTAVLLRFMSSVGKPVVVCSTHLKAGFSQQMEDQRFRQAIVLEKHLSDFAAGAATILAADLNAHHSPYSTCTPRMCCDPGVKVEPAVISFLCDAGFRPAYVNFPSFTAWSGWIDRDVKASLDHILYRGPLQPRASLEVPEEHVVCQWPELLPNRLWPSDHLHLLADLELV